MGGYVRPSLHFFGNAFKFLLPNYCNLPKGLQNPDYHRVGIPPAEIFLRDKLGKLSWVDKRPRMGEIVLEFLENNAHYQEMIAALREKFIYNFGSSSKIEADYILNLHDGYTSPPLPIG